MGEGGKGMEGRGHRRTGTDLEKPPHPREQPHPTGVTVPAGYGHWKREVGGDRVPPRASATPSFIL